MVPPIAIVMVAVVIVMMMARLGEVGLVSLPVAQSVLSLSIEAAMIYGITSRPISGVRLTVTSRENVCLRAR
jgi:hypothetical protein